MPALDVVSTTSSCAANTSPRRDRRAHRATPQGRDWQLTKFNITTPEAQLTATALVGHRPTLTRGAPATRRAVMDFKLALADKWRAARPARHQQGDPRRQGAAGGPDRLERLAVALTTPAWAPDQCGDRRRQFLKAGRARRGCSACSNLQSLPGRLSLDFATCSRKASPSKTSTATSRSRRRAESEPTCACAACGRGADGSKADIGARRRTCASSSCPRSTPAPPHCDA